MGECKGVGEGVEGVRQKGREALCGAWGMGGGGGIVRVLRHLCLGGCTSIHVCAEAENARADAPDCRARSLV